MLKIHYFLIAIYMSVFIYIVPVYYLDNGFTVIEVSKMSAMLSFGAVFQPIFTIFIKDNRRLKIVYNVLAIIVSSCLILISQIFVYKILIILFFVYSLGAQTTSSLSDNIVANFAITSNRNYGEFKKFSTLGWGLGVILCLPVVYLLSPQYMFLFLALVAILGLMLINKSSGFENYAIETFAIKDFKLILTDKFIIWFIIFSSIYNGILTAKSYYLSTLLSSVSGSDILISLLPIVLMIPEVIVLLVYTKISRAIGYKSIYYICVGLLFLLLLGCGLIFNPIILLLVMSLHGVISGLFLPTMLMVVHHKIVPKLRIGTYLVTTSVTYLTSACISGLIIVPLLSYMSLNQTFIILSLITLLCFIPLRRLTIT